MTDRIIPADLEARAAQTFAQAFVATITVTAAAGGQLTGRLGGVERRLRGATGRRECHHP
jgi:hypothetical protein